MNYRFVSMSMLFTACLITANIIAVKIIALPGGWFVPAGLIVFPLSYAFNDVISEVYGFTAMRRVIWLGFFCNLVAVIAIFIGGIWTPAPFWTMQSAYNAILGFTPRLLVASFAAYLVGEYLNAYVLVRIKALTGGRYLWMRTIGSTAVGEAFDTIIFLSLAFFGILPIPALISAMLAQWLIKVAYEIVMTWPTYLLVGYLKKREQVSTTGSSDQEAYRVSA